MQAVLVGKGRGRVSAAQVLAAQGLARGRDYLQAMLVGRSSPAQVVAVQVVARGRDYLQAVLVGRDRDSPAKVVANGQGRVTVLPSTGRHPSGRALLAGRCEVVCTCKGTLWLLGTCPCIEWSFLSECASCCQHSRVVYECGDSSMGMLMRNTH